jgi:methylenetetrahydrofolate dehydrogenase (NADP+)/methenyltetrahydrofolate cyclohydrolase
VKSKESFLEYIMNRCILLEGKTVAEKIREEIRSEVEVLFQKKGVRPKLVVILLGTDPASQVYVRNKKKACEKAGIISEIIQLEKNTSETELVKIIEGLNADPSVHGILQQLPLPRHIQENSIVARIHPKKDVDCFHPENVGRLFLGHPSFQPCTPSGIVELLKHYQITTAGKHVVIVGRSNIVGKPMTALLLMKGCLGDATVTVCHSKTQEMYKHTRSADILIAAIGVPECIKGSMIREGSVVIDVGINRVPDASGFHIQGDVAFKEVLQKASHITPVPGGVGPMTIAMLLKNTLLAAHLSHA